jgi:hypothetical protein
MNLMAILVVRELPRHTERAKRAQCSQECSHDPTVGHTNIVESFNMERARTAQFTEVLP